MRSKVKVHLAVSVLAALMLAALSGTAHAQTSYSFRDLGTLGGTLSRAFGVNDWGHVVGYSFLPGGTTVNRDNHAFYWENGVMTDLGTLPGYTASSGVSINNYDEVVGACRDASGGWRAFIWNSATAPTPRVMEELNTYLLFADAANWTLASATGINDNRQVAGWGYVLIGGVSYTHGYLLNLNTKVITDLGTLPDDTSSQASGLNDLASPQVVGNSWTNDTNTGAGFLYNGTLPLLSLSPITSAGSINDAGEIVGSMQLSGQPLGFHHAVYRSPSGVITDLGTLGGSTSIAYSINNTSIAMVVGRADIRISGFNMIPRAFRWQVGSGAIVDLNTLTPNRGKGSSTWWLLAARKVSNNGYIVGIANKTKNIPGNNYDHAFLLTPQ